MATDTINALSVLRNASIGGGGRIPDKTREIMNKVLQKVGELSHHDTITGTSPRSVITTESAQLERLQWITIDRNGLELSELVKRDEGIHSRDLRGCFLSLNRRANCLEATNLTLENGKVLWAAYNPSTLPVRTASIVLPSPSVAITRWSHSERRFISVDAEAHCSDDPVLRPECEVFVNVDSPPLGFSLLRIEANSLDSLSPVESRGFTVASEIAAKTKASVVPTTFVDSKPIGMD